MRSGRQTELVGAAALVSVLVALTAVAGEVASAPARTSSVLDMFAFVVIGGLAALAAAMLPQASEIEALAQVLEPADDIAGMHPTSGAVFARAIGVSGVLIVTALMACVVLSTSPATAVAAHAVVAMFAAVACIDCIAQRSARWKGSLRQLAAGIAGLRRGSVTTVEVGDRETLVLTANETLKVRVDVAMLRPDAIARAVFAPDRHVEIEAPPAGWRCYRRAEPSGAALDLFRVRTLPSLDRPSADLAKLTGPPAAVFLGIALVQALILSTMHGAPNALPGWALDSPFIYEAARAGLLILALAVATNLLLALASGRLVSKVSAQGGLEFDATTLARTAADQDRTTAEALVALDGRVDAIDVHVRDTVERTVSVVGLLNERLDTLTQALVETSASDEQGA